MKLVELLDYVPYVRLIGSDSQPISDITANSRQVKSGSLFVAVKGTQADGHAYIDAAIAQGATVIVCEKLPATCPAEVTFLQVADSQEALGNLAAAFYGYPSEKLIMIGVTGTNGKTTVATLLYKLFQKLGHKVGLLSTVCNYIDNEAVPSTHTTPDPVQLHALLAQMADAGCRYAFMEVSSHAIHQKRIAGICFDGGIFTNLTRDHLDYHKTFQEYLNAKKSFFDQLPPHAFALTNIDDKNGKIMVQNTQANVYTYSTLSPADFKGKLVEESLEGMLLQINTKEVAVQLVGQYNAQNLLAVYGAGYLLHSQSDELLRIISSLKPVAGRLDTIYSEKGITAVVDYAHTPDAVANTLSTLQKAHKKGKIITVIGCGGNRDKGKRPEMAKIAYKCSNLLILTSDNPRFEKPSDIIDNMLEGLTPAQQDQVLCIENREQAIKTAVKMAQAGDLILVAGKGHEDYQEIEGVKHPFNDKTLLQNLLNK
jgi:UDP-N-acetylmuramoyl-L-alanyl-D-glutamate--2,6-diaminopimelate ligase